MGSHKPATRWLDLHELVRTGLKVHDAEQYGRFTAARQAAMGYKSGSWYDFAPLGVRAEPFVVDFLADTGDGFDATYAMARCLTSACLPEASKDRGRHANLLMLGGDEVYPTPKNENYEYRLKRVFETAQQDVTEDLGYIAAIPGNHDWYDGDLGEWMKIFMTASTSAEDRYANTPVVPVPVLDAERVLGRHPFQDRSYFAAQLPHGWWLWGIDTQLDATIDDEQLQYFHSARRAVTGDQRVILCTPKPSWTELPTAAESTAGRAADEDSLRGRLATFVHRLFADPAAGPAVDPSNTPGRLGQVRLLLSGDTHHYARYRSSGDKAEDAPEHLVTCGGGGAYLSSTHHLQCSLSMPWELTEPGTPYWRECEYPSQHESRKLARGWWRIPIANGVLTPALVLLISGALLAAFRGWWPVWANVLTVVVVAGLAVSLARAFAPRHLTRRRRTLAAVAFGAGHALGYAALAAGASAILERGETETGATAQKAANALWESRPGGEVAEVVAWRPPEGFSELLVAAAVALVVLLVGSWLVFGSYWWVADKFGWHENELFSGMRLDSYKAFVRLVINPPDVGQTAGKVTVMVYGIREVPRTRRKKKLDYRHDPRVEIIDTFVLDP
ncbi:hypothetical protein G7072_13890 [Nocardioides sp. HDW12B]|uniref:hypothetical protein n=1 Tax=Nocardioides sp. HDW12B TaxID=2714939 RepID=UPI00140C2BA3|nr:hypothetical protein [Nocardioides sp. HDW12B]QIK67295.1 hypothetical protein G7072_13890 [Nocardioides sp. HDW12B]